MMKSLLQLFLLILLTSLASGCATLDNAVNLQDDYAASFGETDGGPVLILHQKFQPKITHGLVSNGYSAVLPKGVYTPIASSAGRVFYQAPEGFRYISGSRVESKVGGLVQAKADDDSLLYVWYFPKHYFYEKKEPNGRWIQEVKSGLVNVQKRPWIESELKHYID